MGSGWGTCLHLGRNVSQPRRHSRQRLQAGRLWIRASRSMPGNDVEGEASDMLRPLCGGQLCVRVRVRVWCGCGCGCKRRWLWL